MKKVVLTVLGTRPEITKFSPILPLLDEEYRSIVVHTGQHYDINMDEVFFKELKLKEPDYSLAIGSGSSTYQIAEAMLKLDAILVAEKPSMVLVLGDTNATLSGAIAAVKNKIPVVHLEAGCRCFCNIPEETNRILVDHCADLLLAPDTVAYNNLIREGIPAERIRLVGTTAIEAALRNVALVSQSSSERLGITGEYVLLTFHRADNTDNLESLRNIVAAVNAIADKITVVFPIHPRTKKAIVAAKLTFSPGVRTIEPQGYLSFLSLLQGALFVISDSGGVQEEAAALDIPCLVCRDQTEWTYLISLGKNILVGTQSQNIIRNAQVLLDNREQLAFMKAIPLGPNACASEKIMQEIQR